MFRYIIQYLIKKFKFFCKFISFSKGRGFFCCFFVIELENEVFVLLGNNLSKFGSSLIELFRKNKNENPTKFAKEVMRGYFSEYFQSLDLKKDRKFYNFYCNKKIKPLIEDLLKK